MKTKFFTLILAFIASIGTMSAAGGTCGDNLTWRMEEGVFSITGTGDMTNYLTITPWYSMRTDIEEVHIGEGVTSIGDHAFDDCSRLASIEIPNSVTSIGAKALCGCSRLTSIEIPNSVTSIGEAAFYWCTGLTSIEIPNNVTSIGRQAFSECSGLTSVTIGNSVTSIGGGAFANCTGLTEITIPNSVTNIEDGAFGGCTGLTSIEIPNNVTSIGEDAFNGCSNVTSVTIGKGVEDIGKWAFYRCTNLTKVNISDIAAWCAINFGDNSLTCAHNLYFNGTLLADLVIPNGVTSISNRAFSRCASLTSITIPNSVTSIGDYAFEHCPGLTGKLVIPNGVNSIGASAFEGCSGLTGNLVIPNSVNSIGDKAFVGCAGLVSTSVDEGNSVYDSRDNCNAIIETASNTLIFGCQTTIIPNSVTSIGSRAFEDCSGLTSITIPNSVTSIGDYAFYYCSGLKTATFESIIPPTEQNVFGSNRSLVLYVPCLYVDDYRKIFPARYIGRIEGKIFPDHVRLNVSKGEGRVEYNQVEGDCSMAITAIPDYGYKFEQWSDSVTENPRYVQFTQDTMFTALFTFAKSGPCGDEMALKWVYEDASKSLTISGNGSLNSNFLYGHEAPSQMKTLIICNEVTSIGDSAFFGMKTINHLTIGANVATIGNYAFSECRNFDDITCYANDVPEINATTFANIGNKQYIYLYVPEGRQRAYQRDEYWGEFDVQVKEAEPTQTDDVKVTPDATTADVVWPQVNGAYTYELVIKDKEGNVVCTLIFNAQGQLTSIAFNAPARSDAPQKAQTAGFAFTITGLESGATYNYTLAAKNEGGNVLQVENGSFTTKAPQGIEDIINPSKATKVIRAGQILIQRGDKTYTLTGQEIK